MQYLVNLTTKELVYQALDTETITLTATQAIVSDGPVFGFINSSNAQVVTQDHAIFAEWVKAILVTRAKLAGVEILGVMCSATKEDQMGLTAVGVDYSMTTAAGGTFADTEFNFQNGSKLIITNENFSTIYNLWVPFRRSFFSV
jgi:hypothetical protein